MDIKVSIFEDNKHLRESLQILIGGTPGFKCIGIYPDCRDLLFQLKQHTPDVVLMDIEMPGMNGIDAVTKIKEHFPTVQVLMQTMFDEDDYVFKAICAGASGYILKTTTPSGYIEAIQNVFSGGSPMTPSIARKVFDLFKNNVSLPSQHNYKLTEKEKEILQHLVKGRSYKMMADEMHISTETVKTHMKNIYTKLHVNSNTEAVALALKDRIV
ncbi:MAG: response regulator transcription factor [Bacteroidetes bacterium]|nr:response regulator transcription factor [Bacteroidota bacterium]